MGIKITKLENKLLNSIMLGENDGIGMGYSEYNGEGISNQEKGVLSSLIQKGLVYDSKEDYDEWDYEPMYCTNLYGKDIEGFEITEDGIYDVQGILNRLTDES